jgi:hypothetical protein
LSSNGINWTNPGYDYKIRSVVYSNPQLTGNLAAANTAISRNIATTNLFIDSSCQLIAQLTPAGASAVAGSVTARVWIEQGVPHDCGNPVVARHYQIMPAANATSATGRITLYFTQAEFNAFNADPNSKPNLPANPTDSAGKANLRIVEYEGVSGDNSGLPCTYGGKMIVIDPADSDIVWNAWASRWEVTFNVTGFGGFFAQTSPKTLPLLVENFSGLLQGNANILNWIVNCLHNLPIFEIEQSSNGINFSSIGKTKAWDACNHLFQFKNPWPVKGKNYYRIKVTDNDTVRYSDVILLETGKTTLYPNIVEKGQSIQVVYTESEGTLRITDATGRQIFTRVVTSGAQTFSIPAAVSGVYFYSIQNSKGIQASGKLIVK